MTAPAPLGQNVINNHIAKRAPSRHDNTGLWPGTEDRLLRLGAPDVGRSLPPTLVWWRDFAVRYVEAVCLHGSGGAGEGPSAAILPTVAPPAEAELAPLVLTAPIMPGAEYLSTDILRRLWVDLGSPI
jgi:non-specific serine/threonine protein kinase